MFLFLFHFPNGYKIYWKGDNNQNKSTHSQETLLDNDFWLLRVFSTLFQSGKIQGNLRTNSTATVTDRIMWNIHTTPFFFQCICQGARPLIIKISYFVHYSAQNNRGKTLSWRVTERHFAKGSYHSEVEGLEPSAAAWPSLACALLYFGCGGLSGSCLF